VLPYYGWRTESLLRLVVGLLLCLALGGVVTGLLGGRGGDAVRFLVSGLCFHGALLVLVQVMLREHGVGWGEVFGLREGSWVRVLGLGFWVAVLVVPVAWGLSWVSAEVMRVFFVEPVPQQAVTTLRTSKAVWEKVLMGLLAVGLAPWAEEVLFRGVFYPVLRLRMRRWLAVGATSLFFAAIHLNAMTFVPLVVLSVMLCWLYEETGNLWAPVVAHASFNLANLVFLLRDPSW
jgi:uncharacterized protein